MGMCALDANNITQLGANGDCPVYVGRDENGVETLRLFHGIIKME
jgi:hypothetical protein